MKKISVLSACLFVLSIFPGGLLLAQAPGNPEAKKDTVLEAVQSGFGKMKINGLLQGWYQYTDGAKPNDTFRLRRSEIKLSGEITPMVPWAVMIDPAQVREDDTTTSNINGTNYITSVGRKSVLQDFFITLKPHSSSSFDIGQYKFPFGMEGLESSAKLDLIERSTMVSQFKWADARDIGATYKGDFKFGDATILPSVGMFNGEGQNKLDANNAMTYVGRLVVKPIEALHLGVARYDGAVGSAKTPNRRTGLEAKVTVGPASVYGEYATGESDGKDKDAFYLTATCYLNESFQLVTRYDRYDPNKDAGSDANDEKTIGLNYFLKKNYAKLVLNYVFRGEQGASVDNDIVRALAQVSF
ncbi:MAG: hypothetical protein HYV36_07485 [Lentisphaerae bacterium]|nr:hypothetical protein [Lentisphaerota bacterium]